jgi:hypothetical protein
MSAPMRKAAKFFALTPPDRALVLRTLAPLIAMRAAIWTLTFARVNRIANAMSRPMRIDASGVRPSPDRIAWAVGVASRVVPRGDNCLVRALATGIMLRRYGHPSELKIGVMKPAGGRFEAHAWLESGGSVVIGDFQLDRYVTLAARDSAAR